MMSKLARWITAVLVMVGVTALATAPASANRSLSLSPGGAMRVTSEGRLTFEEPSGSFGLECNVTLNGTLAREIAKRAGAHMGSITEGRTAECRDTFFGINGSIIYLVEPRNPWDITYNLFLGTLPRINGVLVRMEYRMLLTTAIGSCLWGTGASREAPLLFAVTPETGALSRASFLREAIRLLTRLSGTCPSTGGFAGAFRVTPTQTVRLL